MTNRSSPLIQSILQLQMEIEKLKLFVPGHHYQKLQICLQEILSRQTKTILSLQPESTEITDLINFCNTETKQKLLSMTQRELEICACIRKGNTSAEIAEIMGISRKSVENHRNNIRLKLELANKPINLKTFLNNLY